MTTVAETSAPDAACAAGDDESFTWDGVPGQELARPPLFVLVIAEPGAGKTFLGCTFPATLVCLDSEHRANTVLRNFRNTYWKKVLAFDDVRRAVAWATKRHPGGTFLFDSGSDLNALAEAEVVAEMNASKAKVHPTLHWTPVYERISKLCGYLRTQGWNAVFTGRLTDEYEGDKRTGKRTPSGFVTNKLLYQVDFALQIVMRDGKRVGLVLKNGGKKPGTYATELPDEALNYEGILREFEAAPVTVVPVAVGGPSIVPAARDVTAPSAPTLPAPAATLPPVPAPPAAPPVAAPVPLARADVVLETLESSEIAVDDPGKLHGFRQTGEAIERLPISAVVKLAAEWRDAKDRGADAIAVQKEHELSRGGWFQAPAKPELVSTAEVAELEALARKVGSTPAAFWARAMARGWTKVRGELTPERAREIRELLLGAAKAGK
jgi:hypothetical protein